MTSQVTQRTFVVGEMAAICFEIDSRSDAVRATMIIAEALAFAYASAVSAPSPLPAPVTRTVKLGGRVTLVGSVEGDSLVWIVGVKDMPQCEGKTEGNGGTMLKV